MLAAALACAGASAHADPIALRGPAWGRVLAVMPGLPELSAAWWVRPAVGFALEWRFPASAAGASVGTRWTVIGDTLGWGVEVHIAGGVMVPLLDPGVGLSVTPAVHGRWRDEHLHVGASVAVPAVLRVAPGADLRVPPVIELWFALHFGRLSFGLHGNVGSVYVPGLDWSTTYQGSLYLAWDL